MPETPENTDEGIMLSVQVDANTLAPFVELQWGDQKMQVAPNDLFDLARMCMRQAVYAEVEGVIMRWGRMELKLDDQALLVMRDTFRKTRDGQA